MRKSRFSENQIVAVLQRQEQGEKARAICRDIGISEPTFYNWKSKNGGLGRPFALRALAVANAGRGQHGRALEMARVLEREGGEHVLAGLLISAYAHAAEGNATEAANALSQAQRIAPGDPDVAVAWHELTLHFPEQRERFNRGRSSSADGDIDNVINEKNEPLSSQFAPYPNPTSEGVTVPVNLDTDSAVTIVLFDAVGREVARLYDGVLGVGPHAFEVPASDLVSGTYTLRISIAGATDTARFSVVR